MKALTYEITINAPVQKIYETITNKESAKAWISVFSPNSHYTGNWSKGAKITFLTPDEKGIMQGMICTIKENIPYKEIYIQPYGVVKNGEEILKGDAVKDLDKTYERYLFTEKNGKTELFVDTVAFYDMEAFYNERFPIALKLIKEMSEQMI